MLNLPKVLLLSNATTESSGLERILEQHVYLRRVTGLMELQTILDEECYDAVFCDWSFHRGKWDDALRHIQQLSPDLPVIIFRGTGGEKEWVQVLEAGGFDLLVAPYQNYTVLPVLEQAVESYEARRTYHAAPYVKALAN